MKNLMTRLSIFIALLTSFSGCSNDDADKVVPKVLPETTVFVFDVLNNTKLANKTDAVKIRLLIEKQSTQDFSLDPTTVLDSMFTIQVQDLPETLSIKKTIILEDPSKEVLKACLSSSNNNLKVSSLTCRYQEDGGVLTHLKIGTE